MGSLEPQMTSTLPAKRRAYTQPWLDIVVDIPKWDKNLVKVDKKLLDMFSRHQRELRQQKKTIIKSEKKLLGMFSRLPLELRQQIYCYLIPQEKINLIQKRSSIDGLEGLYYTCKRMRSEIRSWQQIGKVALKYTKQYGFTTDASIFVLDVEKKEKFASSIHWYSFFMKHHWDRYFFSVVKHLELNFHHEDPDVYGSGWTIDDGVYNAVALDYLLKAGDFSLNRLEVHILWNEDQQIASSMKYLCNCLSSSPAKAHVCTYAFVPTANRSMLRLELEEETLGRQVEIILFKGKEEWGKKTMCFGANKLI